MSSKNFEALVEQLSGLTILEMNDLVKMLEEKWGVSAAAPVMMMGGGAPAAEAAEEKTEFDVKLVKAGDKKLDVIKEVRAITGLGLKEAKDMAEGSNVIVKAGASKAEAEEIKKKLEAVGAEVVLV